MMTFRQYLLEGRKKKKEVVEEEPLEINSFGVQAGLPQHYIAPRKRAGLEANAFGNRPGIPGFYLHPSNKDPLDNPFGYGSSGGTAQGNAPSKPNPRDVSMAYRKSLAAKVASAKGREPEINEMKERHKEGISSGARAFLQNINANSSQEFSTLSPKQIGAIQAEIKRTRFQQPKTHKKPIEHSFFDNIKKLAKMK